jgi:hypothetical protein
MGEYIMDAPNHEGTKSADVVAIVAGITGYPADKIGRVMFLVDIEGAEQDGEIITGMVYGGNMNETGMLRMCVEATELLYNGLVLQSIADSVPDDIGDLAA